MSDTSSHGDVQSDGGCCRGGPKNWGEMKHQQSHKDEVEEIYGIGCVASGRGYDLKVKKKNILEEANEIINGDRAKAYGHPTPNHKAIASLWQAYLDNRVTLGIEGDLTAADAALMMVLLKIARLQYLPGHRDSVVDGAGYFGCLERIVLED